RRGQGRARPHEVATLHRHLRCAAIIGLLALAHETRRRRVPGVRSGIHSREDALTKDAPPRTRGLMPEGALSGKVVVIVGAPRGMGLSAARACLAAGARVVGVGPPEAAADALGAEL